MYTSNVFARSLYFALAGIMQLFHYLHYGLSMILVFIGGKLLLASFVHINMVYALLVVAFILVVSVLLSIMFPLKEKQKMPGIKNQDNLKL